MEGEEEIKKIASCLKNKASRLEKYLKKKIQ